MDRKKCYETVSRKNLGEDCPEHYCTAPDAGQGYLFSKAMENPGFIGIDDIKNTYLILWLRHIVEQKFQYHGTSKPSALYFKIAKAHRQISVFYIIYSDKAGIFHCL